VSLKVLLLVLVPLALFFMVWDAFWVPFWYRKPFVSTSEFVKLLQTTADAPCQRILPVWAQRIGAFRHTT
jgi:hypothetical protein